MQTDRLIEMEEEEEERRREEDLFVLKKYE
jgi:hypothetical protein